MALSCSHKGVILLLRGLPGVVHPVEYADFLSTSRSPIVFFGSAGIDSPGRPTLWDQSGQLALLEQNGVVLPPGLANAVLKRKVEFAAGRYCAMQALKALGYGGRETLPIGQHRAPLWPDGFVGSISHGDGQALAVAAASRDWDGIGIDVERLLDHDAARPLVPYLMTTAELLIGSAAGMSLERWLTVVFSAKESLFKALYPYVGRYFDFLDAEVRALQPGGDGLTLQLATTLSPQCIKGSRYPIRINYFDNNIVTLCLLAPSGLTLVATSG
ncbi:4'-phosphopantetheinyl transferase superfamily protein [Collimonas arenae]|uniref:Enterobactin synthase component D n=2 Tax=Collimonas arenae TaxID=279058 RepID=A0A127QL57_9BURK|nr:4'-phosphopantetheinyl transferase superfamily protein [Collimonas arenae]